jgi:hypothetical protein
LIFKTTTLPLRKIIQDNLHIRQPWALVLLHHIKPKRYEKSLQRLRMSNTEVHEFPMTGIMANSATTPKSQAH